MTVGQVESAIQSRLSKSAELMDTALQLSTGLDEADRKLIVYWTIATHMLPYVKTFPLLVLRGPMGTGKSKCLEIVGRFAYQPREFVLRGYTLAMIRDEMIAAYEGTVVIEEADQSWKDGSNAFERLLSDRYQRKTGMAGHKVKNNHDTWVSVAQSMFGATALHRRIPFADAALDGRSVSIRFRPSHERQYIDSDLFDFIKESYTDIKDVTFQPCPIERPETVASRIFDSYVALAMASHACGHDPFFPGLLNRLEIETEELKEAQSVEPDGLVLRAILNITSTAFPAYGSIKLSAIAEWIFANHSLRLAPRQIGGLARSLGLTVKESHGSTVVQPTVLALLKATRDVGYGNQQEIDELKSMIPGFGKWWGWGVGGGGDG